MKILKNFLIILLFTIFGCSSDQSNLDVIRDEENISINQTNSVSSYNLEEILNGIRTWDSLRNSPDELLEQFGNYNALKLDMSQFPQGNALHAYACMLNGELKFAVISEVYDDAAYEDSLINYIKIVDLNYTDVAPLADQTYESYNFPLPTQYIQATDAINRIYDWNTNYENWLSGSNTVYQSFHIPTYSLQAQEYTVYFGLKNNIENSTVKDADLVLYSNIGSFYDTVLIQPPFKDRTKNFILDLL